MAKRKTLEQKTIPALKKLLDTEFSIFIRNRDNHICFTCGGHGREAGHYIPRAIHRIRYDERNVHAQCTRCNCFLESNHEVYEHKMRAKYGDDLVDQFNDEFFQNEYYRLEKDFLIEKIKYYRNLNKER